MTIRARDKATIIIIIVRFTVRSCAYQSAAFELDGRLSFLENKRRAKSILDSEA